MDQTLLKVLARHADELCNSDTSRAKTSRLLSDSNHPYAKMDLETISNHIFDSVNRIKLANSILKFNMVLSCIEIKNIK